MSAGMRTFKKHFVSLILLVTAWLASSQSFDSVVYPTDTDVFKPVDGAPDQWTDGSIVDYDPATDVYEVVWSDMSTEMVDAETVGTYVRNEQFAKAQGETESAGEEQQIDEEGEENHDEEEEIDVGSPEETDAEGDELGEEGAEQELDVDSPEEADAEEDMEPGEEGKEEDVGSPEETDAEEDMEPGEEGEEEDVGSPEETDAEVDMEPGEEGDELDEEGEEAEVDGAFPEEADAEENMEPDEGGDELDEEGAEQELDVESPEEADSGENMEPGEGGDELDGEGEENPVGEEEELDVDSPEEVDAEEDIKPGEGNHTGEEEELDGAFPEEADAEENTEPGETGDELDEEGEENPDGEEAEMDGPSPKETAAEDSAESGEEAEIAGPYQEQTPVYKEKDGKWLEGIIVRFDEAANVYEIMWSDLTIEKFDAETIAIFVNNKNAFDDKASGQETEVGEEVLEAREEAPEEIKGPYQVQTPVYKEKDGVWIEGMIVKFDEATNEYDIIWSDLTTEKLDAENTAIFVNNKNSFNVPDVVDKDLVDGQDAETADETPIEKEENIKKRSAGKTVGVVFGVLTGVAVAAGAAVGGYLYMRKQGDDEKNPFGKRLSLQFDGDSNKNLRDDKLV